MAVLYSTGFENVQSVSDLRSQGWVNTTPATGTQRAVPWISPRASFDPTKTGQFVKLTYISGSTTSNGYPGVYSIYDTGYYNTGVTLAQLWASGGFSVGYDVVFTPPQSVRPYFGASSYGGSVVSFGGKLYGSNANSTNGLFVSTDNGITFSAASPMPTTTGRLASMPATTNTNDPTDIPRLVMPYANNAGFALSTDGSTWSTRGVSFQGTFVGMMRGCLASTSYRQWAFATQGTTTNQIIVINSNLLTGTVSYVSLTSNTYQVVSSHSPSYTSCPYVAIGTNGGGMYIASQDADLSLASNWVNRTLPNNNVYYLYWDGTKWWAATAGATTWYTNPNQNASGTWTAVTLPSTTYAVRLFNGLLIALGLGVVYTSTNGGSTWSTNAVVGAPAATANGTAGAFAYELTPTPDSGLMIVPVNSSYGGLLKTFEGYSWSPAYSYGSVSDFTDANVQAIGSYSVAGMYGTQPPNPSTNVMSINSSTPVFGFQVGAQSGNNRNLFVWTADSRTAQVTLSVDATVPSHYIELVAKPSGSGTGPAYAFTLSVRVDGTEVWNSGATATNLGTATGDVVILNIPRYANFGIDNVVFCDTTNPNPGPLGPVSIVPVFPSSDVSVGWIKTPAGAASNAVAASGPSLSQTSQHYVTASILATDEYGHAALSGGNSVLNVSVQGYYSQSNGSGSTNLSVKQNGTIASASNTSVPSGGSVYVKRQFDRAPDGTSWDMTKVNGTTIVNSKTS